MYFENQSINDNFRVGRGSKKAHKYGHYKVEIIGHGRYLNRSKWPKNVGINRQLG